MKTPNFFAALLAIVYICTEANSEEIPLWWEYDNQHTADHLNFSGILLDIANHVNQPTYGPAYYVTNLGQNATAHEMTHGANSSARLFVGKTLSGRFSALYVLDNKMAVLREPNFRKSQVASYIPASLRESRFSTYVTGQSSWDDRPLYLLDEWVAYTNGAIHSVSIAANGHYDTKSGQVDFIRGDLELGIYCIALLHANAELHPDHAYSQDGKNLRKFVRFNLERSYRNFQAAKSHPYFGGKFPQEYHRLIQTAPDADQFREFIKLWLGAEWSSQVMEIE